MSLILHAASRQLFSIFWQKLKCSFLWNSLNLNTFLWSSCRYSLTSPSLFLCLPNPWPQFFIPSPAIIFQFFNIHLKCISSSQFLSLLIPGTPFSILPELPILITTLHSPSNKRSHHLVVSTSTSSCFHQLPWSCHSLAPLGCLCFASNISAFSFPSFPYNFSKNHTNTLNSLACLCFDHICVEENLTLRFFHSTFLSWWFCISDLVYWTQNWVLH